MSIPLPLVREVEQRYLHAWPALISTSVEGWTTCASGGWTDRANCVVPLSPTARFPDIRERVEQFAQEHGIPCTVRVNPLAPGGTDDECARAGYEKVSPGLGMIAEILTQLPTDRKVILERKATLAWKKGYAIHARLNKDQAAQHDALVDRLTPPVAFVSLLDDSGSRVAFGYGSIESGMVGIFDIVVGERYRGRGCAQALTVAILNWAGDMGCRTAYLLVNEDNAPARAVYARCGFREAYRYHYRKKAA